MWKYRIPSVVALILGFVLLINANRLAGPRMLSDGSHDDRSFVIHTAASVGGMLICLFALAEMLHSVRKWLGRRRASQVAEPGSEADGGGK